MHCAKAHGEADLRTPIFEDPDDVTNGSGANASTAGMASSYKPPRPEDISLYVCAEADRADERNFYLYFYKTKKCEGFPWNCQCNGFDWHRPEERRRGPEIRYVPIACPHVKPYINSEWGDPANCKATRTNSNDESNPASEEGGDNCEYAHTLLELMYHPQVYKTGLCDHFDEHDASKWRCVWKKRCAHAHGRADLRSKEDAMDEWKAHTEGRSRNHLNIKFPPDYPVSTAPPTVNNNNTNSSRGHHRDRDNLHAPPLSNPGNRPSVRTHSPHSHSLPQTGGTSSPPPSASPGFNRSASDYHGQRSYPPHNQFAPPRIGYLHSTYNYGSNRGSTVSDNRDRELVSPFSGGGNNSHHNSPAMTSASHANFAQRASPLTLHSTTGLSPGFSSSAPSHGPSNMLLGSNMIGPSPQSRGGHHALSPSAADPVESGAPNGGSSKFYPLWPRSIPSSDDSLRQVFAPRTPSDPSGVSHRPKDVSRLETEWSSPSAHTQLSPAAGVPGQRTTASSDHAGSSLWSPLHMPSPSAAIAASGPRLVDDARRDLQSLPESDAETAGADWPTVTTAAGPALLGVSDDPILVSPKAARSRTGPASLIDSAGLDSHRLMQPSHLIVDSPKAKPAPVGSQRTPQPQLPSPAQFAFPLASPTALTKPRAQALQRIHLAFSLEQFVTLHRQGSSLLPPQSLSSASSGAPSLVAGGDNAAIGGASLPACILRLNYPLLAIRMASELVSAVRAAQAERDLHDRKPHSTVASASSAIVSPQPVRWQPLTLLPSALRVNLSYQSPVAGADLDISQLQLSVSLENQVHLSSHSPSSSLGVLLSLESSAAGSDSEEVRLQRAAEKVAETALFSTPPVLGRKIAVPTASGSVSPFVAPELVSASANRSVGSSGVMSSNMGVVDLLAAESYSLGATLLFIFSAARWPGPSSSSSSSKAATTVSDSPESAINSLPNLLARYMVLQLMTAIPSRRLSAGRALIHPLFWTLERQLDMLNLLTERISTSNLDATLSRVISDIATASASDPTIAQWQSVVDAGLVQAAEQQTAPLKSNHPVTVLLSCVRYWSSAVTKWRYIRSQLSVGVRAPPVPLELLKHFSADTSAVSLQSVAAYFLLRFPQLVPAVHAALSESWLELDALAFGPFFTEPPIVTAAPPLSVTGSPSPPVVTRTDSPDRASSRQSSTVEDETAMVGRLSQTLLCPVSRENGVGGAGVPHVVQDPVVMSCCGRVLCRRCVLTYLAAHAVRDPAPSISSSASYLSLQQPDAIARCVCGTTHSEESQSRILASPTVKVWSLFHSWCL